MNHPKISCLLLEDDQQWLDIMEETLKQNFPELSLHPCNNIKEAGISWSAHKQTLLILDINLPDGISFDWLQELQKEKNDQFRVIFTTAFADYALPAFKFSALDFLLKPYLPQDLLSAVDKALKSLSEQHYHRQLETFIHNYTHQDQNDKKIVLKTLDEIFIIPVKDILTVEADNSYTRFLLKSGQKILVSQSLKEFDTQLSPTGFMRVHQSHLVNLKHITGYRKKTNMLLLEGDLQIPVSQNKKNKVMSYLNNL
ncbi:two component transcriptional regulator, LytTR family [Pedobacter westerhofensis]|uniref:Two component transcriptional regulator, LytTR family n=1 Tax=Pedobacter westerhofensis TaxID=425512 RepID=A0A521ETC2_9SPHI|nr:LytTR family DNA-binding domain-containing protein [Pedobacter westerhofensis]SMO87206.1 two component transcriptional regulator, LytTR family [Pedobacter westerhofensis]